MSAPSVRRWRPGWPCSPRLALTALRRGPGDPTFRVGADGVVWRGVRTPAGPATLAVEPLADGEIVAQAWGGGAAWVLDALPRMLGADDDVRGFVPHHDVVARLWRRHRHDRIGATGLVMESLVPAIIEQKVTGEEAFRGYRLLVTRFGDPAPGPLTGLRVPPTPEQLSAIPSWEWLRLGVDHGRSRPLLRAAQVASSLERAGRRGTLELDRALRSIPGIGVWTSAEVRTRVLGDPDAVSFGDFHVARDIGHALTGTLTDDAGLAELLAPYAPHRYRVQRLVVLGGLRAPRRGPRMPLRTHLPTGR